MNQPVQVVITMGPNGVNVQGPLNDKLLCYGLLEVARDMIQSHKPEQPGIVIASRIPAMVPNGR